MDYPRQNILRLEHIKHMKKNNRKTITPNKRLQPTCPRLWERTLDCGFEIPAKMVTIKRKRPSG
jgi:hypothetical protein